MEVEYCDYRCFNLDYDRIFRPNGLGSYLFLYFLEPMYIKFGGKEVLAKPGACLIYSPDYPQDYRAAKVFHNSYVQFSVQNSDYSMEGIMVNHLFYPQGMLKIDQLIEEMYAEYINESAYKEEMLEVLIQKLMIECKRQVLLEYNDGEIGKIYEDFRHMRFQLLSRCEYDWKITDLCNEVHLEKSQFYEYYERFFQSTPKVDLLQARMNKAKQLLINHEAKIENIAISCGFMNASHFSRQFKRMCGCSPNEFRRRKLSRKKENYL